MAGDGEQPSDNQVRLRRYELLKSFVPILYILALALPIYVCQPIASDLAGKSTHVTLTVSISIAVSLALASGYWALLRKTRAQAEELRRQRRRITTLEEELEKKKP